MDPLNQRYRTALVTGASGGLGAEFVDTLLREGIEVWGTARDLARLSRWSGQSRFHPAVLDLVNNEQIDGVFADIRKQSDGGVDLLINNAGFGLYSPFHVADMSGWEKHVSGHLIGSARAARLALSTMVPADRGCIVNVSSVAVDYPLPFMTAYNVSKAGLSALSESLMFETRGSGVTVIDFRPGDYRTNFNHAMQQTQTASLPALDERLMRCWGVLEKNVSSAPLPAKAARDLLRAIRRGRSGTVYSGSFFQTKIAVLFSKLAPANWRRAIAARYFGAG